MGTSDVHVALARVVTRLEELQIPYAICGGMAIRAWGLERTTTGVDLLLTATGCSGSRSTRWAAAGSRSSPAAAACATPNVRSRSTCC